MMLFRQSWKAITIFCVFCSISCTGLVQKQNLGYGPLEKNLQKIAPGPTERRVRTQNGKKVVEVRHSMLVRRNYQNNTAEKGWGELFIMPFGVVDALFLIYTDRLQENQPQLVYSDWEIEKYLSHTNQKVIQQPKKQIHSQKNFPQKTPKDLMSTAKSNLIAARMLTKEQFEKLISELSAREILALSRKIIPAQQLGGSSPQLLYFPSGRDSKGLAILTVQLAEKSNSTIESLELTEKERIVGILPALLWRGEYVTGGISQYQEYQQKAPR